MTIEEYEMRFMTDLEDSWVSGDWDEWLEFSYKKYLDSVAEQELNMELNQL